MTRESVIKWVLLVFVVATICWALVKEIRKPKAVIPSSAAGENAPVSQKNSEGSHKVIAYYFHGTRRCTTCRRIEAYTHDALFEGFSGEIENGLLEWRPLNVDETENEHFIQDYKLTTRSVVLSSMENGQEKRWKNLDKIWTLVGDQHAFAEYIKKETRDVLGGG